MTPAKSVLKLHAIRPDTITLRRLGVVIAIGDLSERLDLARYLCHQGFEVCATGSGVEALSTFCEYRRVMDVMVFDASLRDLPGMAFLKRFQANFPDIPCVFLTDEPESRHPSLISAGAIVLPRAVTAAELSDHLVSNCVPGGIVIERDRT